jgi:hypothetical protein
MTIDLRECEFNARDTHIIDIIRDLESARQSAGKQ